MAETSATLLERLSDRSDSVAWRRLVDLYSPLINGWLRRHGVSVDDAEDLTQEVLGVVVREVSRFAHNGRVGAFRTWLRTITINCLRQSLRSRRVPAKATGSSGRHDDARPARRPEQRSEPPLGSGARSARARAPAGADRARVSAGHVACVPAAGHRWAAGRDGCRRAGHVGQCRFDRQVSRSKPLAPRRPGARRLNLHVS